MPLPPDPDLANMARTVVRLCRGTWNGHRGMCLCPAHADRTPSLSVSVGFSAVLFHCFAGCSSRAVLDALARKGIAPCHLFGRADRPIPSLLPASCPPPASRNARRLWREAAPLPGSPAARYLHLRGITTTSPELRFHPRTPLGPSETVQFLPAMLAAVRSDNDIIAIHRTFIESRTGSIAPFDGPKRALGRLGTGAARLTQPQGRVLGLAEGIENALSATQMFGIACWATLGNARFGTVAIPETVKELHLFLDEDAGGCLADRKARAVHARPGLEIISHSPGTEGLE